MRPSAAGVAGRAWQTLLATSSTRILNPPVLNYTASYDMASNRPISVYHFPRGALTLCPQHCMSIEPGVRFPAQSAEPLSATLYGHFTEAIYRIGLLHGIL